LAQRDGSKFSQGEQAMLYLIAGAAGLLIGLLIAPKTGEETRERMKEQFTMYKDRLMRKETANGAGGDGEVATTGQADYLH
jgi:gas vesicle protein